MDWDAFKAEVKERIDIVDLISQDAPGLTQSGSVWRNADKWPSLIVWPETNTWRDHGGGIGGDAFSWLTEQRGLSFIEAARELASIVGVEMPVQAGEDPEIEAGRREIFRALTWAALRMHEGMPRWVRAHLRDHYGLGDDIMADLAIGYSDGNLYEEMLGADFNREVALGTGLFVPKRQGGAIEFFETRIVFPYWQGGSVVYAIGRRTDQTPDDPWQVAKYKKLPTRSQKFSWVSEHIANDVFYNEDAARKRNQVLLITEGVTDCIAAHQAGIPCISPVTVRFRTEDIPRLRTLTERAGYSVICNDADNGPGGAPGPGLKGAMATAGELWPDRDVRIAQLPAGGGEKMDVNFFLRERGEVKLRAILGRARRLPEWSVDRLPADAIAAGRLDELDDALRLALPLTPLEQSAIIRRAADRLSASVRDIRARMQSLAGEAEQTSERQAGEPRMLGEIFAGPGHYFAVGRDGAPSIISSFRIRITHRVMLDNTEMLSGDVRCRGGRTIRGVTFPPHCWTSRQRFVSFMSRVAPDIQWTGSDNQVQGLLAVLASDTAPARIGTDRIGWLDTDRGPRWVTPDAIIGPGGVEDEPDVAYVSEGSPLDSRCGFARAESAAVAEAAMRALPAAVLINEPHVILPIVGWFFAAALREPIQRILGHFPLLFVWGSAGSGKTEAIRCMCRMMGVRGRAEPFSATETEFSTLRLMAGTNGLPVWMDEYKPFDMPPPTIRRLHRYLRRLYAGERENRGRPDLTVKSYRLGAPVVVSGEARFEERALIERSIVVCPRRGFLESEIGLPAQEAFSQLSGADLSALSRPYIQFALRTDVRGRLANARALTASMLNADAVLLSPRVVDNIVVMMFGLLQWERFAHEMGIRVPDIEEWMPGMMDVLLAEMAPGGATADELDRLIDSLGTLAASGWLEHGKHFRWARGSLNIYLPGCLRVYQERQRMAGQRDETNGLRSLKRLAAEKVEVGGYVLNVSHRTDINGTQLRCIQISPEDTPDHVDLDGFGPQPAQSTSYDRYVD